VSVLIRIEVSATRRDDGTLLFNAAGKLDGEGIRELKARKDEVQSAVLVAMSCLMKGAVAMRLVQDIATDVQKDPP
jgi:hypothetical protein